VERERIVIFALGFLGLPLRYLIIMVTLAARRNPTGLGISLFFFACAAATGVWAIMQSRASTAGIGMLGIPLLGSLAGFFGFAFGRWRASSDLRQKVVAWTGLSLALLLVAYNLSAGVRTREKNSVSDQRQAAHSAEIGRDREVISAALKQNPGRERAYLDSIIKANINDRAFVLAALPNDSISPGVLDTLADSPDLGIALEAVRNPATTAETLTRVYRTKSYPDYFFQALAAHHHTPPEILRELYERPRTISGLEIWFAGNPSTPREILHDISRKSDDRSVIAALLENPSIDCPLLTELAVNLMKRQNRDADNPNVARVSELVPTVCKDSARG
jgi:hypothetical protein